jgi:hypothetical protein
MVHAFIDANFDDAPTWLNEGLASLFEQPVDRGGHIAGATNWRLPALQSAIEARRAIPLDEVLRGGRGDFSGDRGGAFYAESRYLLYWLQERGLLVAYYRAFASHVGDDPTGMQTLESILGERDIDAIQSQWESFVGGLRYERS